MKPPQHLGRGDRDRSDVWLRPRCAVRMPIDRIISTMAAEDLAPSTRTLRHVAPP